MKAKPSKVSSAQSAAKRVPELLAGLSAELPAERQKAIGAIMRLVIKDATLTRAAVEVTPILVAATAPKKEPKEKGPLLALLADLAVGGHHISHLTSGFDIRDPSFAELPADHPLPVVHREVAAGLDNYIAALGAGDAETRAAAAFVLAFLAGEAARSIGPVRARAEATNEPDERARASAVLSLGYLTRYLKSADDAALLGRLHDESKGLVRVAAALSLVQVAPASLAEGPKKTLHEALTRYRKPVAGFPWCNGEVAHFASLALACAAVEAHDPTLLLDALDPTEEMPTHVAVANALVDATFADEASPSAPRAPATLSPVQRKVLKTIVDRKLAPRVMFTLAEHGVPPNHEALRRYLGLAPKGPLDREVDGEPLWRLGVRAIHGDAAVGDRWVAAVTEGRDADDVVATVTDALEGPYALATLIPVIDDDSMENERRRTATAVQLAGRALAKALSADQLRALGDSLREDPERPLAAAALIAATEQAAGAPLAPAWDNLIAGAAAEGVSPALRQIVAALPEGRREAVIRAVPFTHEEEEDENEKPVIHAGGAWALADLCPTKAIADAVVNAIGEIDPDDDAPPPVDRAKEIFAAMGEVGKRALAAAVKRKGQPQREVLQEILRALG